MTAPNRAVCIEGLWFMQMPGNSIDCGVLTLLYYTNEHIHSMDSADRWSLKNAYAEILHRRYLALYDFCSLSRSCMQCTSKLWNNWQYLQIYM